MEKLFLKLLNMSLTAGWLVLAILLLRPLLKKAPRWVSCALWGLVALRLLLPFSIESGFSLLPTDQPVPPSVVYEEPTTQVNPPVVDTPVVDTPVVDTPIVDDPVVDTPVVDTPVVDDPVVDAPVVDAPVVDSPVVDTPVVDTPVVDAPVVETPAPVVPTPAPVKTPVQKATTALAWVWVGGLIALLIYALDTYICLRLRLRGAVREQGNVWRSERIRTPFVLGVFRPRVYLPFGLTDGELTHVLAHEQAHIARRDHLIKPFGFLLLSVYWFNPLLWVAYTLLCRDIELACDERVVKTMAEEERRAYSTALLNCSIRRLTIAAYPLAFGEVGVKERVKHVLNYKKPAFWIVAVAIVAVVALTVGFFTVPKTEGEKPTPDSTQTNTETTTTTESTTTVTMTKPTTTTPESSATTTTTITTTKPTTTTTKPTTPPEPTEPYPRADGVLTKKEKEKINTEIERTLERPLNRMLEGQWGDFPFDTDLFEIPERAAAFIWQRATQDRSVPHIEVESGRLSEDPDRRGIKEEDYAAFYSRVLGQEADINAIFSLDDPYFERKDGYIYGTYTSDNRIPFELKVVSFAGNDTTATLTVDMLTAFVEQTANGKTYIEFDDALLERYWNPTLLDYPAEAVFARMTLQLIRTEEGYIADRLYFTKPANKPPVQESVIVGDHGNGITSKFNTATGVLTVSGKGVVENLYPRHQNDLEEYDNGTIKKVVIEEGITHIKNSFNHLVMVKSIEFPSTLEIIEESFIENGEGRQIGKSGVLMTVPANVKKICNQSFNCTKFEELIFEGAIEISGAGCFWYSGCKKLTIPSGSVLCNAFDCCFGLREIVLQPGVIFCDHKSHSSETGDTCFGRLFEQARVYAYAPVYIGEEPATVESLSRHFWNVYLPIIIPEGESIENYRDKHEHNEEDVDTGFYNDELSAQARDREFQCRLPED